MSPLVGAAERGPFLALEGVEGAGKTTQARLLARWLESRGVSFRLEREPGGTDVGEAIRHVVQDRPELSVPPETELLLYLAARAAFVREIVAPALERGELFIADRFSCQPMRIRGTEGGWPWTRCADWTVSPRADWSPISILFSTCPSKSVEPGKGLRGSRTTASRPPGANSSKRSGKAIGNCPRETNGPCLIDACGTADQVHALVRATLRAKMPATFALLEE